MSDPNLPLTIGWKERISFLDWNLRRVEVKIDTGARTSAVGAVYYEVLDLPGGGRGVDLLLALDRRAPGNQVKLRVPCLGTVRVRNSAGECELRPVIVTLFRHGPLPNLVSFPARRSAGRRYGR